MPRVFGLIGKTLSHSFSKKYFTEKFETEGIDDCRYELFELPTISDLDDLLQSQEHLKGLNVTIPYKTEVIPKLDEVDDSASRIGAVNVIKLDQNGLKGFNSDYYGFRQSLSSWLINEKKTVTKALVLGTGGAAMAVKVALEDMQIESLSVSRKAGTNMVRYEDLDEGLISEYSLVVNTTPVGMHPNDAEKPAIPYHYLTQNHLLYDLVYNPELTSFMKSGQERGAAIKSGLEMLHLQAEKSWEIWNS